jgi:hypothetical protein
MRLPEEDESLEPLHCDACGLSSEETEDIQHVESETHNANLCLPCRRYWGEDKGARVCGKGKQT